MKMAAVIHDRRGVVSWGWNSAGRDGMGMHAEEHAVSRANRKRLRGATITVAGMGWERRKLLCSLPCLGRCLPLIRKVGIKRVEYMTRCGEWEVLE